MWLKIMNWEEEENDFCLLTSCLVFWRVLQIQWWIQFIVSVVYRCLTDSVTDRESTDWSQRDFLIACIAWLQTKDSLVFKLDAMPVNASAVALQCTQSYFPSSDQTFRSNSKPLQTNVGQQWSLSEVHFVQTIRQMFNIWTEYSS